MPRKAASPSNPSPVLAYEPPLAEYCEILRDYSLSGLAHLKDVQSPAVTKLRRRFRSVSIEEDEWTIRDKFKKIAARNTSTTFGLLPMPKPGGGDLEIGFFIPRFSFKPASRFTCSFCLMLWRDWANSGAGKSIAFRLEVADPGAHCYPHVQMSRAVRAPDFTSDWPDWLMDSYPAFPLATGSPIGMFLSLVTALHGYDESDATRYARLTLQNSMHQASSPGRANKLAAELSRLWPRAA